MQTLASPVAVGKLIELLRSTDEAIVARASTAILDRAGVETATKASTETSGETTVIVRYADIDMEPAP